MVEISWSKRALKALDELFYRIAQDSPQIAEEFVRAIMTKTQQLERFREMGRIVPELQNKQKTTCYLLGQRKFRSCMMASYATINRIDPLSH